MSDGTCHEQQLGDEGRIWRAWLGGSVLGIVNAVVREQVYKDEVGDRTAHYIATATLIVLLALYFWMLDRTGAHALPKPSHSPRR